MFPFPSMGHLARLAIVILALGVPSFLAAQNRYEKLRPHNQVNLYGGYALSSQMKGTATIPVSQTPYGFDYNRWFSEWEVYGGVTSQFANVSYEVNQVAKSGLFYALGLTVSKDVYRNKTIGVNVMGAYYPYAVMAVASQTDVLVNETEVTHSALTTFTGNQGFAIRGGVYIPTKTKTKYRLGSNLEIMMQRFSKQAVKTVSSDPDLAPVADKTVIAVDNSLTTLNLLVFVALVI